MSNGKGGFIGQDGLNAPDPATGVSASGGDTQATVSFTAPSDVGGAAITGYSVQSNNGDGTYNSSYDLSSASYDGVSFDVSSQDTSPNGMTFNADGTKLFIIGRSSDSVYQYTLSTAFDLSTASYSSVSFSVASQDANPFDMTLNNDGTKMYMVGRTSDSVYQYSLSTAFDLSTASYNSVSFSVASQETNPSNIAFNNDGTKMYIMGVTADAVFQYSLSTAFDLSTASYDSVSFSITQDTAPEGMTFNADGTKLFMVGSTGNSVYQYSLSTAFDLSTASYNSVSFSVASQDNDPSDILFNNNGTKMYMVGRTSDSVYQYTTGELGYPTASPVTVTGLTNGTSYTFNVWAINPFGWSSPSDASGSVSPVAPIALVAQGLRYSGGFVYLNTIDQFNISSTGNATDFGDLTVSRGELASCSSSTRGVFAGGQVSGGHSDVIDYVTITSSGNATDFGNLISNAGIDKLAGLSSEVRGVFAGGNDNGYGSQNVIQYITIASTGNASDFGDLLSTREWLTGTSSSVRGVFAGSGSNVIEYITIASTGNATDFGDLTRSSEAMAACSNGTRGLYAGGNGPSNVMDYITIASTGNATDFGDLTQSRQMLSGTSGSDRGVFSGGQDGSQTTNYNTIDYVTISSAGNATDFGNLTLSCKGTASCSNSHGGLS